MPAKILVIDDEMLILNAVQRALSRTGYLVYSAGNAEELSGILKESPFDLLITDVHLIDEPVDYVIECVTKGSPLVKVLMMSGSHNTYGAPHFIEKPFSIEGLRQKVKDILDEPR